MRSEDFYKIFLQYPQICTDSRKVTPGCLYFSLKGDQFDGNRFAAEAIAKGAAYAVTDDPSFVTGNRFILVPDVLRFLQELASYHRSQLNIPVIGLTGTNGKTTTKELILSVLKQKFKTVATAGNLNNHIGVPLTLLTADHTTNIMIVEMGANHPGEIAALCNIAKPTAGLITNIGKAHLEGFGSYEGVIQTKNELYTWIKSTKGQLFVNQDDQLLMELVDHYPCTTYGTRGIPDVSADYCSNDRYISLSWRSRNADDSSVINSHLSGGYNISNILAAITVGHVFGLSSDQIKTGIESYVPENMRSQWIETGSNTIFLDAYNANPSSMSLAISHFASLNLSRPLVILGDMFELGSHEEAEHLSIIEQAGKLGFEKVLFTGARFNRYAGKFPHLFFENTDILKEYLNENRPHNCNILIKGSRGMQLEKLVSYL